MIMLCALEACADASVMHAVRAVHDVMPGEAIRATDVSTVVVPRNSVPSCVIAGSKGERGPDATLFPSKVSDVQGRISKGIRKGQLLYFSYPGFRGPTVVLAERAIPKGDLIRPEAIIEKELCPMDIPWWSVPSKEEAIKKISAGIEKGQIVTFDPGGYGQNGRGGAFPLRGANMAGGSCFQVVKDISAGAILNSAYYRHFPFTRGAHQEPKMPAQSLDGRRVKHDVRAGAIIFEDDLVSGP